MQLLVLREEVAVAEGHLTETTLHRRRHGALNVVDLGVLLWLLLLRLSDARNVLNEGNVSPHLA